MAPTNPMRQWSLVDPNFDTFLEPRSRVVVSTGDDLSLFFLLTVSRNLNLYILFNSHGAPKLCILIDFEWYRSAGATMLLSERPAYRI